MTPLLLHVEFLPLFYICGLSSRLRGVSPFNAALLRHHISGAAHFLSLFSQVATLTGLALVHQPTRRVRGITSCATMEFPRGTASECQRLLPKSTLSCGGEPPRRKKPPLSGGVPGQHFYRRDWIASSRAFLLGARKHWHWRSYRKKQRKKCQSLTQVMLLSR